MNAQDKQLADTVQPLLDQVGVFGDKFDTLTKTISQVSSTATAAQKEISDALQAILQRTAPVPDVDVADLVNKIDFASQRVTGEIASVDAATAELTGHSDSLKKMADGVSAQASAPPQSPGPTPDPNAAPDPNAPPAAAASPGASGALQSSFVPPTVESSAGGTGEANGAPPPPAVVEPDTTNVQGTAMSPVVPVVGGTGQPLTDAVDVPKAGK